MTGLLRFFCTVTLLIIYLSSYAFDNQTRVAFFYGDNPPFNELHAFNVVVINPPFGVDAKDYNNAASELYAYVSVGELDKDAIYAKEVDSKLRRGKNPVWDSAVMDLANPAWGDFLLNKVFAPLWESGYRGFFLDTLDSYQLLKLPPEQNKKQLAGLVRIIKSIKTKYPDAHIILNRGFEIIDDVHQDITAMAVESLFSSWDNDKHVYQEVPPNQRQQLLTELNKITKAWQLPIIIIDYVAPEQHKQARSVAEKIMALGYIPWVSDAYLTTMGIGAVELIPRRILILYNEKLDNFNDLSAVNAYNLSAFILQYMGFIPILQHVDETLPTTDLTSTYAGIIAWFDTPVIKRHKLLEPWLAKQIKQQIPVVFMENFGLPKSSPLLRALNLTFKTVKEPAQSVVISYQDKSMGYDVLPKPNVISFMPLTTADGNVLLKLTSSNKDIEDAVAVTPWGGYALEPFNSISLPNTQSRWVVNPFTFFRETLRLPIIPVPDVTTENGRRILTVHIDGDAFISRAPSEDDKYTGEIILEQILKRYHLPTTTSIIQREFELISTNPALSDRLTKVAQEMFALPWVQIATHTYSHPLQWGRLIEGELNTPFLSYPDKNYFFDYKKEIDGSVEFINTKLAPPDKKVKTVFWSGDANVQEKPLQLTYDAGLRNINGMSKIYSNSLKSVTNLGPLGMYMGKYFHVFAPIPNEFEYTDDWARPLYAFEQAIHSFELTEKPVRYKPISIYYHFYSAADQAAFRALLRIYDWAVKQYTIPLQITDYIDKVTDFNKLVIARYINDGSWLITNNPGLREFRWPQSQGFPDLDKSTNVIGFNAVNTDYYIHLGNAVQSILNFTTIKPAKAYLLDANAQVTQWGNLNSETIQFTLQGYMPLNFKLENMADCKLFINNQAVEMAQDRSYSFEGTNSGSFEIRCNKRA